MKKDECGSSMSESDLEQQILHLLATAGYVGVSDANASPAADVLTDGLIWCITSAANHNRLRISPELLSDLNAAAGAANQQDKSKVLQEALRSIGCPYSLHPNQIQHRDLNAIFPVLHWLITSTNSVQMMDKDQVSCAIREIEKEENAAKQLEQELDDAKKAINMLNSDLNEQTMKTIRILKETQYLQGKLDKKGDKELDKKESDIRSSFKQNYSNLQADVISLEEEVSKGKKISDEFCHISPDPVEKLNKAKSDLAAKMKEVLSLKRQLDDVPCQSELIQYERRFSELYAQIQEKHRQTSKYYATYNALLEIKELVLKETSLLNSMISQFQDAINNPAGRIKLIKSMEAIAKGTQQKLDKVEFGLQNEQKICESVKEKYARLIADQRQFSSLLKTFQEEYTKNEKFRRQIST